jgi:hypothetical protein
MKLTLYVALLWAVLFGLPLIALLLGLSSEAHCKQRISGWC